MDWYRRFYTNDFRAVVGFASEEQTKREVEFVLSILNSPPNSMVADLCCGYGRHARLLAEKSNCQIFGIDLSREFLESSVRGLPNLHFVCGDMRRIPCRESFDVVLNLFTSFGFFETDSENEMVLAEVARVLKPGGLLLLDYENKFSFVVNDVIAKQQVFHETPDGTQFVCQNEYDVFQEREIFRVQRLTGNGVEESGYSIRLYSFPELKDMLRPWNGDSAVLGRF